MKNDFKDTLKEALFLLIAVPIVIILIVVGSALFFKAIFWLGDLFTFILTF